MKRFIQGEHRGQSTLLPESLDDYIAATDLSAALGVTKRQLAAHNMALQSTILQGSKHVPRGLTVRLPADRLDAPAETLLARIAAELGLGELETATGAYEEAMHLRRELRQPSLAIDDLAGLARDLSGKRRKAARAASSASI